MTIHDPLVYGERPDDLAPGLLAVLKAGEAREDGLVFFPTVRLEPAVGRPLLRALMRAEAELLLEEAEELRRSQPPDRTPEQRRADALVRVGEGIRQTAAEPVVTPGNRRPGRRGS